MTKTFDIIDTHVKDIKSMSYRLNKLASAFYITGNSTVADELYSISDHLKVCADGIFEAYNGENMAQIRQSIANSERFFGRTISSLLEGVEPKEACLAGFEHHFDRDIIDAHEKGLNDDKETT